MEIKSWGWKKTVRTRERRISQTKVSQICKIKKNSRWQKENKWFPKRNVITTLRKSSKTTKTNTNIKLRGWTITIKIVD